MRIDSHQHYWTFNPERDQWINDSMHMIRRDFYPPHVKPLMDANAIEGCVAVQADQSEEETHYLLNLGREYDFIKGVVGWIDLCARDINDRLAYFSDFKLLKGFRHIVQSESQTDFILRNDFCNGISLLGRYGFTYDILIYPRHLKNALEFVKKFPEQKFVLDHIAKPFIRNGLIDEWERQIREFGGMDHVYCKIAGLVTEADWHNWSINDFIPYLDVVLEVFGPDRVMFGSDWPVCLTAASYGQVCDIVERYVISLSGEDQNRIWGGACSSFYEL